MPGQNAPCDPLGRWKTTAPSVEIATTDPLVDIEEPFPKVRSCGRHLRFMVLFILTESLVELGSCLVAFAVVILDLARCSVVPRIGLYRID